MYVEKIILFRTNNLRSMEEENLRLFIQKSKEMFDIEKIFGDEKENGGSSVFRIFSNFDKVLNAIAKLSKHSERSQTQLLETQV